MRKANCITVGCRMSLSRYSPCCTSLRWPCCIVPSLVFNGHPVAHAITLVFLPALSDTGGLFFGAWFGKHKLSPRISPKKSVEGLFGSILFAG